MLFSRVHLTAPADGLRRALSASVEQPRKVPVENLSIRAAQERDLAGLFPIAVEFATSFTPERGAFGRSYRRILAKKDACLLVAELEDGLIIGYLLGFEHATFFANGSVAWVEEIAVSSSVRRHGIGRSLMMTFEAWADSRGARLVALATRRAAPFYSALGYEKSAAYFRKIL